jgi:hypothetical protein
MKKNKIITIIAVLFFSLLIMGCPNDTGRDDTVQGKLIILQAYGNAGDDSPAGVSHSFVELYNISDKVLNLDGISLYYANGIRGGDLSKDEAWKMTALSGTIPARGSFLVLGAKHKDLSGTRYKIEDDYGDINDDNLSLNRRGFKAALIKSTEKLTVQNPFNTGGGAKVSGYIDMVGAVNNPDADPPDNIFGYETSPARNSASSAVRRIDLLDTDNNYLDFAEARYALTGEGAFTNEMLEVRKPRNSSAGSWDPFTESPAPVFRDTALLILQVFGAHAANDSAPTHSFIELYNKSDATIDLSSFSVHWANGLSSNANAPSEEDVWHRINLKGNIPAKSSYLILGRQLVDAAEIANTSTTNGKLNLTSVTADINEPAFAMSNRSYKIALMSNQLDLTVQNPWGDEACIDLVSAINDSKSDSVTSAKGADDLTAVNAASGGSSTISKQKSWRRKSLDVSDQTLTDFTSKQYSSLSDDDIAQFRPRTTADKGYTPQF